MSGGLAPSKSTVYVSNLPFSLTNSDLHKVFEKHGRVAKVTIAKDKESRRSKGVAFVLFIDRDSAHKCVHEMNNSQMFGRTIKCSIAKDNGRAQEFIRRKVYKDKTKCYECGESGHLSYNCPHNLLGDRDPPPKKEKKKRQAKDGKGAESYSDSDSDVVEEDSLSAAIRYQQQKVEQDVIDYSNAQYSGDTSEPTRKKYKKDDYFSDEEELD